MTATTLNGTTADLTATSMQTIKSPAQLTWYRKWQLAPSPVCLRGCGTILLGIEILMANVYALLQFVAAQARILAATGAFFDLIAWIILEESSPGFPARLTCRSMRGS